MNAWTRRLLPLLLLAMAPVAYAQVAQDRSAAVVFTGANEGGAAEVDGFRHGVVEAAGKDAAVRVLATEAAEADPAKVAATAKVRFVFLGTIQRDGGDFAISARLVDAQSGREVWNGRFFSDEDDLMHLPDEIAISLVAQLKAAPL